MSVSSISMNPDSDQQKESATGNAPLIVAIQTECDTTPSIAAAIPSTNRSNNSNNKNKKSNTRTNEQPRSKRPICSRCHRPIPRACICEGLPATPITLRQCHILVLQHPHEERRKNCSLPLIQLCLAPQSMTVVVSRRFGDQVDPKAMALLQDSEKVLLIFPDENEILVADGSLATTCSASAMSLSQARDYACAPISTGTNDNQKDEPQRQEISNIDNTNATTTANENHHKTVVVILDATWKYAKEMDRANIAYGQYPPHLKRVALSWEDAIRPAEAVIPCRFDIRTPPSQVHLSTAECVAWVINALEETEPEGNSTMKNDHDDETTNASSMTIYSTLMKPLDVMVAKWKACQKAPDNHHNNKKHHNKKLESKEKEPRDNTSDAAPSRNYEYYSNPDHITTTTPVETEEEPTVVSRASFFTVGDDERAQGKQKGRKRRR